MLLHLRATFQRLLLLTIANERSVCWCIEQKHWFTSPKFNRNFRQLLDLKSVFDIWPIACSADIYQNVQWMHTLSAAYWWPPWWLLFFNKTVWPPLLSLFILTELIVDAVHPLGRRFVGILYQNVFAQSGPSKCAFYIRHLKLCYQSLSSSWGPICDTKLCSLPFLYVLLLASF